MVRVKVVNGTKVRNTQNIDFTMGGHNKRYSFIPRNEIWLEDTLKPKEKRLVLLHELHELGNMLKGKGYEEAHKLANRIEGYYRKHPNNLEQKIRSLI
jgi:hypothetical protein